MGEGEGEGEGEGAGWRIGFTAMGRSEVVQSVPSKEKPESSNASRALSFTLTLATATR